MSATHEYDADDDRYAELSLEDGSVVIYDAQNPAAWIQSDAAVACASLA